VKILVVSPYPVWPLTHGGRVRTYRLAAGLARAGAAVDVLCPWHPGALGRPVPAEGVTCHRHLFAANVLPAILDGGLVPPLAALSWQPFCLGPRRRFRRTGPADIVQFEFCAHPGWMERVRAAAKVVYSAHNVEYDFACARTRASLVRAAALRRVAAIERRAVRASHLVVTCTHADARRLRELYGGGQPVAVVPNGFDEALLHLDRPRDRAQVRASLDIREDQAMILFVGGPAQHNKEAVEFLERQVMPELGEWARLVIAGACGRRRRKAEMDGRVHRLGYVDDLRMLYAAADIAVNPVPHGSGSSVKVAEYLAARLPVLTTPAGARGYEAMGSRLRIAERSQFAEALAALRSRRSADLPPPGDLSWTELGRRLHHAYTRLLAGEEMSAALP
jgi:glycosyltransferase involved in cell wall biosynthesis